MQVGVGPCGQFIHAMNCRDPALPSAHRGQALRAPPPRGERTALLHATGRAGSAFRHNFRRAPRRFALRLWQAVRSCVPPLLSSAAPLPGGGTNDDRTQPAPRGRPSARGLAPRARPRCDAGGALPERRCAGRHASRPTSPRFRWMRCSTSKSPARRSSRCASANRRASATVVTAEQIRALGFRTLADVLRSVRGVVVSSDRTYSYLGVRGFSTPGDYNTRVLLLIDGNRVNDTIYDQAFLGSEFPLDIDLVERVEFIPGQGSAGARRQRVVRRDQRRDAQPRPAQRQRGVGGARQRRRATTARLDEPCPSPPRAACCCRRRRAASTAPTPTSRPSIRRPPTTASAHRTDHERGQQLYAKYQGGELAGTLIHADRTQGAFGPARDTSSTTRATSTATPRRSPT